MKICRRNPLHDGYITMDLPITKEQFNDWRSGTLIQNAMPNLTSDEREFVISGITPGQWDELCPDVD